MPVTRACLRRRTVLRAPRDIDYSLNCKFTNATNAIVDRALVELSHIMQYYAANAYDLVADDVERAYIRTQRHQYVTFITNALHNQPVHKQETAIDYYYERLLDIYRTRAAAMCAARRHVVGKAAMMQMAADAAA